MEYTRQDKICMWLNGAKGMGCVRANQLIEAYPSPDALWDEISANDERAAFLPNNLLSALLKNKNESYIESIIENLSQSDVYAVTLASDMYPELLRKIANPPILLYVRGRIPDGTKNIAIVGTRRCTYYGQRAAKHIAGELCEYGVTIVSGMARGIDTAAHEGALGANGKTIAVLGCGADVVYPRENYKLYESIISAGAVISEYPPGTEPLAANFPVRNRLISGLARGTLVAEAGLRSGSNFTVDYALEQGRDVFAIPGDIFSKTSAGANKLIKDGAKLTLDGHDILDEYGWGVRLHKLARDNVQLELDMFESRLVQCMEQGQVGFDDLLIKTDFEINRLNSVLTILELKGIIKQLPGKIFVLND